MQKTAHTGGFFIYSSISCTKKALPERGGRMIDTSPSVAVTLALKIEE